MIMVNEEFKIEFVDLKKLDEFIGIKYDSYSNASRKIGIPAQTLSSFVKGEQKISLTNFFYLLYALECQAVWKVKGKGIIQVTFLDISK